MVHPVGLSSGQVLNMHEKSECKGDVCPVHKPSDHEFRSYDLFFNGTNMVRRKIVNGKENIVIDPDDYLFNLQGFAILRNAAYCKKCESVISSVSVHEYVSCPCGNAFVDGGLSYFRGGAKDPSMVVDLSEVVYKEK